MEKLLPTEIALDIFSRLPAESVLECKQVCKTWRNILSLPYFADMHLHYQLLQFDHDQNFNNKNSNINGAVGKVGLGLLFLTCSLGHGKQLYYGKYDDNDEQQSYKRLKRINHHEFHRTATIIGSCNGLVCFSNFHPLNNVIYLYNPITKECVNLPRFSDERNSMGQIMSGFGYHPSANEYKVVRFYYPMGVQPPFVGQVQVYTLGSRCGWRNKEDITFPVGNLNSKRGILANGALHWMDKEGKILAFDLADEEFHLLPSPPCFQSDLYSFFELRVLESCLCVVHHKIYGSIDIWSLKKTKNSTTNNVKEVQESYKSWNWSREFSIAKWQGGCNNVAPEILALTKSGEVLLWDDDTILSSYDPKTATLKQLVGDNGTPFIFHETIPHINSFVSLKALGERSEALENMKSIASSKALGQKTRKRRSEAIQNMKSGQRSRKRIWNDSRIN
ncbi:F-box domain [Macleaya cordata]|uniref:F-box domain n=1 Tax=Macleaya cordata TaxID=56857 RepID=A0A200QNT9_MACCD|nr:F-box domain [Macleaya cordata]